MRELSDVEDVLLQHQQGRITATAAALRIVCQVTAENLPHLSALPVEIAEAITALNHPLRTWPSSPVPTQRQLELAKRYFTAR